MKQEQTQEIEARLSPEVEAHLAPLLDTYHELLVQVDLLDDQAEIEKAKIWKEMELFGIGKCELSQLRVKEHRGETTRIIDKMKFVTLGGDLKILEQATVNKPKKAYLKIERTDKPRKKKGWDDDNAA